MHREKKEEMYKIYLKRLKLNANMCLIYYCTSKMSKFFKFMIHNLIILPMTLFQAFKSQQVSKRIKNC